MATKIQGTVTRLVAPEGGKPARVFFRPGDPEVYRTLDGSQYLASGEIAVAADISAHQVGDEVELEI